MVACIVGGLLLFVGGCSQLQLFEEELQTDPQTNAEATAILPADNPEDEGNTLKPFRLSSLAALLFRPKPVPTKVVEAMPIPTPGSEPYTYHTIESGESLTYLAMVYNTEIETLVEMNDLQGPTAGVQIDQVLRVPIPTDKVAPDDVLLADSEVVYGPGYVDFDATAFVDEQGGYLVEYTEYVDGKTLTGAEVVERVAEQYSVGPRLLLALLEHYGGWVTNKTLTEEQLSLPLGSRNPIGGSLYHALAFTANRINAGYYGYKRDGFWIFKLPDYTQAITPYGLNAGTVGVQNLLSLHADWETWQEEVSPNGFMTVYRELFGDPSQYEVKPLVPITLTQPPLSLPWEEGQGFYFTSGPHAAYVDGSAWAAVDFGPPDVLGSCFYSDVPVTAAADGMIVVARTGEVYIDLDGDGNIQTGWVLFYLHTVPDVDDPVVEGQRVKQGDVIGYASCEGGLSNSSHLHFARRYNGEWMAAGGPVPMTLSGWVVQPNLVAYEGTMVKGIETRESCECWEPEVNLIVNNPRTD